MTVVSTRNNTRNQLTADFQIKRFCIFNNEYIKAVFKNNTGVSATINGGIFVARDTTTPDQVLPVTGPLVPAAVPVLTGSTSGGTLAANTYYIKQVALSQYGEALPSAEANVTTTGSTSSIAVAGVAVPGAVSYRTYIGTTTNAEGQYFASATPNITLTTATGTAKALPTVDASGNLDAAIGILLIEGPVVLANNGTVAGSIVINGVIDATMLSLPLNTTLDTAVGNKAFKDVINGLGFKLDQTTVENTKYDN